MKRDCRAVNKPISSCHDPAPGYHIALECLVGGVRGGVEAWKHGMLKNWSEYDV